MAARIFAISDTHFAHENIYKFVTFGGTVRVRPEFDNAKEADEEMVRRWNETVNPEDHVYHLGDVALGSGGLNLIKHLNGHKRLVLGNHDPFDMRQLMGVGFQKIYSSRRIDGFLLTHIPVHKDSLWARQGNLINVHGHIHERDAYGPEYRNICVEKIGYRPVLLETLK